MTYFSDLCRNNWKRLALIAGGIGVSCFIYRKLRKEKKRNLWRPEWKRDTVYLHVFPRNLAKSIPNISPYAIKLETWLRINKIPYEVIDFMGMSRKGQSPFILFNGEEIPDSNFIIEYLSEYFHVEPVINEAEDAVARAFRIMIEEHTKWTIFWYQADHMYDDYVNYLRVPGYFFIKWFILHKICSDVRKAAWTLGIGRHSNEEIYRISCDDIRAISKYLGNKQFLMGERPTVVDCTVFGFLTQIVYLPLKYPQRKAIEESPNVIKYMERIKSTYWKDWDDQFI